MAGMQKYMMYIVPFFSLTGLYWQYGLVLYWVTTNLWTLGQQYFMFRNWTTEDAQAASATASAARSPARAAQGSPRPASTGPKSGTTSSAKTATSGTKSASAPKAAAAGSTATAAGNGRSSTSRPAAASTASGRVRTGSATRDAAANASGPPNGQNGAAKRGLLRLGRPKQEAVAEPEVPATKVVRQQPVRQARSKRSGKR
jgi:YidC/Oxa1 family membrane protein insertase